MPLIQWQDKFAIGITDVDHEHRQLVALINALHARLDAPDATESVSAFFGDLYAGIAAHFALEERIMREEGYDQYEEHKADHERLLDRIRDIMDDYESGYYRAYRDRLAGQLEDWFSRHFRTHDARLHGAFEGRPHGA
jgi:hemerythrin-like metal-binding protein